MSNNFFLQMGRKIKKEGLEKANVSKKTSLSKRADTLKGAQKGANYLSLAFQMGILIFFGAFGGLKLDQKIGTSPLFIILFSFIAIALSMYNIIRKETYKHQKK